MPPGTLKIQRSGLGKPWVASVTCDNVLRGVAEGDTPREAANALLTRVLPMPATALARLAAVCRTVLREQEVRIQF